MEQQSKQNNSVSTNKIDNLSVSLLGFWVKGKMSVDQDNLHVEMPNTVFFGMIPTGKVPHTIQLSSVSDVGVATDTRIGGIALGVIIAIVGLASFHDSSSTFGAILLLALGVLLVMSAIKTSFYFNAQGKDWVVSVPFFERERIQAFESEVNAEIAKYNRDRNTRVHIDRSISANTANTNKIVSAINNNGSTSEAEDETVFCSKCGAKNAKEANFCVKCGQSMK